MRALQWSFGNAKGVVRSVFLVVSVVLLCVMNIITLSELFFVVHETRLLLYIRVLLAYRPEGFCGQSKPGFLWPE